MALKDLIATGAVTLTPEDRARAVDVISWLQTGVYEVRVVPFQDPPTKVEGGAYFLFGISMISIWKIST